MAKAATPALRKADLRKARERELISVTRRLFDERGMQDAPIEAIAKEAGIARGLIYRQFSSKEELFVVTVNDYLTELAHELEAARAEGGDPEEQLRRGGHTFGDFCVRYPAFLDCALSLMRRQPEELSEIVSDLHFLRLGQNMSRCINTVATTLREGKESGDFTIDDPDYTANFLWTQVLGAMHLTRIGVGVKQAGPGLPELFTIESGQVVESCVASAISFVTRPA